MQKTKRNPTRMEDADGRAVVSVPLANWHKPAILDAEDFDRLVSLGFTGNWTFNDNGRGRSYVRCALATPPWNLATIARLIMAPPRRTMVRYYDDDRLNLRRSNLYLESGEAEARELEALSAAAQRNDSRSPVHAVAA